MMAAAGPIEFKLEKTLGEGAFGKVFLCCDKCDSDKKYAMKVIDLSKSPADEREAAEREARLLSDFRHENIIAYIDSFQEKGALCIVTEFCDGGDLSELIEQEQHHGRSFSEDQIVRWFRHICSGLQYLHGRRVLHRDIKTQNVFLTGPDQVAKLGDLGLAKVLERPNAKAVTFCGSPYYMSPEIFACKPYDTKSDIWAMGVCIYEMSTLERPFDAMLMQQLVFKIVHGELPPMPKDKYSPQLCSVLEKMLCKDSKVRPTADDILADPLFTTFKKPKTPPPIPPRKKFAKSMAKSDFRDVIMEATKNESRDVYDMSAIMDTLNEKQKKYASIWASSTKGVENILSDTVVDKKKDFDKDKTIKGLSFMQKGKKPPPKVEAVDVDDVEFDKTLQPPVDPKQMVNLVVHTLTQIFPKGADGERDDSNPIALNAADTSKMTPEELLLHQISMLQAHCCKVLGMGLFRRAYDLLDATDDNMELEEKLIKLLTPEKFGLTGVQLFYCKNFEYNLEKLMTGSGQSSV